MTEQQSNYESTFAPPIIDHEVEVIPAELIDKLNGVFDKYAHLVGEVINATAIHELYEDLLHIDRFAPLAIDDFFTPQFCELIKQTSPNGVYTGAKVRDFIKQQEWGVEYQVPQEITDVVLFLSELVMAIGARHEAMQDIRFSLEEKRAQRALISSHLDGLSTIFLANFDVKGDFEYVLHPFTDDTFQTGMPRGKATLHNEFPSSYEHNETSHPDVYPAGEVRIPIKDGQLVVLHSTIPYVRPSGAIRKMIGPHAVMQSESAEGERVSDWHRKLLIVNTNEPRSPNWRDAF